jgi:multisubunit Na+/H+ antiporter MnhB subunit
MNAELIFGALLAAFAFGVAAYVVLARDLFAVMVGFVAYGLLLSLAWMVLSAPDVAITEAALGSGVMGALLFGACAKLRRTEAEAGPGWMGKGAAGILCIGVTGALVAVVLTLPEPAPTLAPEAKASLDVTGLGNAVTAVLMVYRALDTMLEKVVLLLALVGVWSLAPNRFWGGRPVYELPREKKGPLLFLARCLIPAGLIAGVYLFWVSADDPGGAFAGGAILSAMALLAFLAGVRAAPAVGGFWLRVSLVIGVAIFLLVGMAGLAAGAGFLSYPDGLAKPVIVVIEVAMTLSIGVTLALLVTGPPAKSSRP